MSHKQTLCVFIFIQSSIVYYMHQTIVDVQCDVCWIAFISELGIGIAIGSGGTLCFACIILMVVIVGKQGKGCK